MLNTTDFTTIADNSAMYAILAAAITTIVLSFFIRNIMMILLSMETYDVHKKRLKELTRTKTSTSSSNELDLGLWIEQISKPLMSTLLTELNPNKKERIEHKLRIAKWDKTFSSALQYQSLNITFKIVGVVLALLMWNLSTPIAIIWGGIAFFGLSFFLNNSYNNRKEALLQDFPDFIRIAEGYITSGMPFAEAIKETIPYVGEEWQEVLKKFTINIEMLGENRALDELKHEVDIFEVREFVSVVKLTLEQGGEAKQAFNEQAERLLEMRKNIIEIKIGQRQTMSVILQGPILLSSIVMFALPTIGALLDMGIF